MTRQPLRLAVAAMGTRFELVLLEGQGDLRAAGDAALDEIELWHRRLSRFAPDSLVSHINRDAHRAPVNIDRDTFELLSDAIGVWRASGGAFDITVAPAMARAGYADSAVSAREGQVGGAALQLDAKRWTIGFGNARVSIDLGGIGKGHALDCAARTLRDAGVTSALLHGGTSSVVAIGAPGAAAGWRIAVPGRGTDRVITLRNAAMSVSDATGQGHSRLDRAHIIDPRRGIPVSSATRVTVIGPSARLADAWSTALVVLGRLPAGFPSTCSAFIDSHETALT